MGYVSFTGYPVSLAAVSSVFVAMRYNRDSGQKTLLPNIRVESVHYQEGAIPPTAQFSYVFATTDPSSPFPTRAEQVWPLSTQVGPYVVLDDDEVLVYEVTPSNALVLVFHGFAKLPQINVSDGESATFVAVGVACRLWDDVIEGALYRNGDDPEGTGLTNHVETDLPSWFNPKGEPNKTPDGFDLFDGDADAMPAFLDAGLTGDPAPQDEWTLGPFARYLCWLYNPSETFVKNPTASSGADLDTFLQSITPVQGSFYDVNDDTSFTRSKIPIRSYNPTNKPWIEALEAQLKYHGFFLFFNTREDENGKPLTEIILFRKDGLDGATPKKVSYPSAGGNLTDKLPDANAIELVRDRFSPVNEWVVETGLVLWEVSLVLAPLFPIAASDATDSFIDTLRKSQLATANADTRKLYRHFGVDEAGEGHWDLGSAATVTDPFDLDDVFGKPAKSGDPPLYVHRLRKCVNTLNSLDNAGVAYKADLSISTDYAGKSPAVYDGTGTRRSLGNSSWKLLADRIGVEITADNPDKWTIPNADGHGGRGDVVRGVKSLAAPDADNPKFFLILTVVIPSDQCIKALAPRRDASPVTYTIRRRVDGSDHFKKLVVHKSSFHNTTGATKTIRDDTKDALSKADALRGSNEFPATAGGFTVPWISHAFGVGDLISEINGRDMSLATNAGSGSGESPYYPTIVGFSLRCQEPQSTVFKLSDRRSEPERV